MLDTILALAAIAFKVVGVGFLFAAALGVMRFSDPFQRMHAATKAGTVGAGFVVIGVVLRIGETASTVMGLFAILFLLFTIPVAGHLLGRASYVSGAPMSGREGNNALEGVLDRTELPLEERLILAETQAANRERAER